MSLSSDTIVSRLLQGDMYEPKKRLQNISTAMVWIQQQLEGMKESDRTLINLFQQLESDMSEVKSEPRQSQLHCPVSPMNGMSWTRNNRTDTISLDNTLLSVPEHKSLSLSSQLSFKQLSTQGSSVSSIFRQMEEEDEDELAVEDQDSDSDSLDDFADTLGGDDEEEEQTVGDATLTQTSSHADQPVARTLYHQSAPQLREKEYDSVSAGSRGSQSSGLATVGILTHTADSPKLQHQTKPIARKLSNDSGVQFCSTDTESTGTGAGQGSTNSMSLTATRTARDEEKKDPASFADEIFAMLNF